VKSLIFKQLTFQKKSPPGGGDVINEKLMVILSLKQAINY